MFCAIHLKGSSTPTTVKIIGKISSLVPGEEEGLRGERATINTRMRVGQLLRQGGSSSHPLQCYEQSNILQGPAPTCVMCRAKYL